MGFFDARNFLAYVSSLERLSRNYKNAWKYKNTVNLFSFRHQEFKQFHYSLKHLFSSKNSRQVILMHYVGLFLRKQLKTHTQLFLN